jgi:hypothetical protein
MTKIWYLQIITETGWPLSGKPGKVREFRVSGKSQGNLMEVWKKIMHSILDRIENIHKITFIV